MESVTIREQAPDGLVQGRGSMAEFFHVDRMGRLHQGMDLVCRRVSDIQPMELQRYFDRFTPHGVTSHGDAYLACGSPPGQITDRWMELVLEYHRRVYYPDKPSRYESVFGLESIADAQQFCKRYAGTGSKAPDQTALPIWELSCDEWFRCDMNLLVSGLESLLAVSYLSDRYWRGEAGPDPFWEVILVPPVHVRRHVGTGGRAP